MSMENWDMAAAKSLASKHAPSWFSYYIGKSYLRATMLGLRNIQSKTISLLKTDLWNEGIEYERDILGEYENFKNLDIYGIDISRLTCLQAKSRLKKTHVSRGHICTLPFKSNFFSIILDLSTLDHVDEKQALIVLREYSRVLRKNGILVLVFWHKSFCVRNILKWEENATQHYFLLDIIRENLRKDFNVTAEYGIGTILCYLWSTLFPLSFLSSHCLTSLPTSIRNRFLDLVLDVEYSEISKKTLKDLSCLYAIIAKKR